MKEEMMEKKAEERLAAGGRQYRLYSMNTIVVGSGAAGLNAAASLYKNGQKDIAILTEGLRMGTSLNTGSDKQTYYKLTTSGSESDSVRKMAATLFDGGSMDGDLALIEAALSLRGFYHLVDIGVPFPCNSYGEYAGYKTDHDPNRRGSSAGPLTSKFMTEQLLKEVQLYGIRIFDGYQVIEILTQKTGVGETSETRARGVLAMDVRAKTPKDAFVVFAAENVIWATGSEAGMYEASVYPVSQTGATGAAFRTGARGKNLTESQYGIASLGFRWNLSGTYQQVLPRYVSTKPDGSDEKEFLEEYFPDKRKLLLAIFLKGYQWPFDPRKTGDFGSSLIDLLVYQETVLKGRRVFLDYTRNPSCLEKDGHFDPEMLEQEAYEYLANSDGLHETPIHRLQHMNPAAIDLYRAHGIDLSSRMLEIGVCAQHNNGGLAGNIWWESNIRHLFPVGEVNGSHGVYRPGGSALNSGQVGSMRAAVFIANRYRDHVPEEAELSVILGTQIGETVSFGEAALSRDTEEVFDVRREKKLLGSRMSENGACIRSLEGAGKAIAEARAQLEALLQKKVGKIQDLRHYYRVRDLLVSQIVYLSAIRDYIERGGVSRGSYLVTDPNGEKPLPELPELFRFRTEDPGFREKIQEAEYTGAGVQFFWRERRMIPEEDEWFEKVWKDFREGNFYQ